MLTIQKATTYRLSGKPEHKQTISVDGREYVVTDVYEVETNSGRLVEQFDLLGWCIECGALISLTARRAAFWPTKRCKRCRGGR
jgi:hypothetical protein